MVADLLRAQRETAQLGRVYAELGAGAAYVLPSGANNPFEGLGRGILGYGRLLGNALARTDEYQALRRAMSAADDDREMLELRNELTGLEERIELALRSGRDPDEETARAYESCVSRVQAHPGYQRLVAAQSNFDKVLKRVNDTIAQGMQEGATSRIILSR